MNVVVLTAAGTGTRMHQDIPKQFMHVSDKPIIIWTMEAFEKHPNIDAIIISCLAGWESVLWSYAKQFNITKLKWVVTGGATGQESILNALKELEKHLSLDDTVIIHDGNRPLVTQEIISNSLATFARYGDSVAAIPCTEVVFRSKDGSTSDENIPREELLRTQTPHVYTLGKLLWAHAEAAKRGLKPTAASCQLMFELGEEIHFSAGSELNLKITTVEDISLMKALAATHKEGWLK